MMLVLGGVAGGASRKRVEEWTPRGERGARIRDEGAAVARGGVGEWSLLR